MNVWKIACGLIVFAAAGVAQAAIVETWDDPNDGDPWPAQWTVTHLVTDPNDAQDVTTQNQQGEIRHGPGAGPSAAIINTETFTDPVQQVDLSIYSTSDMLAGIIARYDGTDYYLGRVRNGKYQGSYGNYGLDIIKVVGASESTLAHYDPLDKCNAPDDFGHLEFSVSGGNLTLTYTGPTDPNEVTISATDVSPLTGNQVGLYGRTNVNSGRYILFDNYSAVPEPATLALLAMGGAALLMRKRRA